MELAAKAVGHVALAHGAYTAEYVNFELKRALEWLDMTDRKEERRLAAVNSINFKNDTVNSIASQIFQLGFGVERTCSSDTDVLFSTGSSVLLLHL